MMGSVSLIMIAFALGGLMEKTGLIAALLQGLIKGVHTKGRLVMATVFSSIGVTIELQTHQIFTIHQSNN